MDLGIFGISYKCNVFRLIATQVSLVLYFRFYPTTPTVV